MNEHERDPNPRRGEEELARLGDEPTGPPRPGPDPQEGREKLAGAGAEVEPEGQEEPGPERLEREPDYDPDDEHLKGLKGG